MRRQFRGWIPNVTGRISFSSIGKTEHPTFCKYSNKADRQDRYLVAFQKRDTRDFIFPKKLQGLISFIMKIEGPLYFAVMAQTSDHNGRKFEKFDGKIFIFHNRKTWKAGPRRLIHKYIENQNTYNAGSRASIQAVYGKPFAELELSLASMASFHVEFTLLRDGEITITHDTDFCISKDAPIIQNFADEDYVKLISSQTFFS